MKSVAIAALCFFAAVAAEADAEADAHTGYYGYHLGHFYGKRSADAEPAADADADAHYGAYGYGYPLVAPAPVVSTVHGGLLHGLTYGGLYGHYYGKRSADAEPTAATAMLLPPMDTMATPATTDIPTCTTATATT